MTLNSRKPLLRTNIHWFENIALGYGNTARLCGVTRMYAVLLFPSLSFSADRIHQPAIRKYISKRPSAYGEGATIDWIAFSK